MVPLGQTFDVALVEELDADFRVQLPQSPELAVLPGHEGLLHHRDLDVEILLGKEEVRGECTRDASFGVLLEHERAWLVLPGDPVPVEDLGTLALGVVDESRRLGAAICLERSAFRGRIAHLDDGSGWPGQPRLASMPSADRPYRIAHLSDLHCGGPYFEANLLERAISEINELRPDIVVCSGDLTTFGFKHEYLLARQYLDLIDCDAFVVVPGNPDARNVGYVHFEDLFGERSSVLHKDGVTVVAVDSTEPDLDHGQIGRGRYGWIQEQFAEPADLRIFVLHHHLLPVPGTGRERNVVYDAGDAIECLLSAGVQLVLSGHKHVPYAWRLENLFVVNTGTVSSLRLRGNTRPCYNVVEINGNHVSISRRHPFHGEERIIQFSTETFEYEKYTSRIEREITSRG